jgi:6-pyruvoyltetrahydropterin/6-carboxytetrahydropterin synthase
MEVEMDSNIKAKKLKYHNKRVAITKEITFDAAHHLDEYEGKCKNIHGHTYKLSITISGFVNEIGIVIDFYDVKQMFEELIMNKLDHKYLNDVLPNMNPTVDNIVVWVWEQFDKSLQENNLNKKQGYRVEEINLFETPTSYATIKREWMLAND